MFAFAVVAASTEAAPARSSAVDEMWIGNESCFKADKSLTQATPITRNPPITGSQSRLLGGNYGSKHNSGRGTREKERQKERGIKTKTEGMLNPAVFPSAVSRVSAFW